MPNDLATNTPLVIAAYAGLGGLGLYFVQLLWKRFVQDKADNTITTATSVAVSAAAAENTAESEARQNVVTLQDQRIDRLEARLAKYELDLETERERRQRAESQVFDLTLRVRVLEQVLRANNIVPPT